MVLIEAVAIGIVLGLVCGGRLATLARLPIRGLWLVYAAIVLQVVAFPSGKLPWATSDALARVLWVASYALLLSFLLTNFRIRCVPVIALGLLCNLAAILANKGHMPASPSAVRAAGLAYRLRNNSITTAHANLGWLTDRWAVPRGIPLGNVFSIGDVLIAVGTATAIWLAMCARERVNSTTPTAAPTQRGSEVAKKRGRTADYGGISGRPSIEKAPDFQELFP
jgi:hypothetical protein